MAGMIVYRKVDGDPVEYLLEAQPGDVCLYHDETAFRTGVIERLHCGSKHRYVVIRAATRRILGQTFALTRKRRIPFNRVEWIRRRR